MAQLIKQSTNMAKEDLDLMEVRFNDLLQKCVEGVDRGEITYKQNVAKINSTRIDVPLKLLDKLDNLYNNNASFDKYRGEFVLDESKYYSSTYPEYVSESIYKSEIECEKSLFSESEWLKQAQNPNHHRVFTRECELERGEYLDSLKHKHKDGKINTRKVYRKSSFFNISGCEDITKNIEDNNYITTFFGSADLSILKDFELFKDNLTIVQKNFITRKSMSIQGVNVSLRDAKLLVPPAFSLDKVGKLYGGALVKVDIPKDLKNQMGKLLVEDFTSFKEYAVGDAVTTLVHGVVMAEYNNQLGDVGVPLTVSSLTGKVIRRF